MTQSQHETRQQLIDDSALLLDRIESHGFELDRRICVLRNSGDPVELPLDLEALVRIATFCSTANLQLQKMQEVLTNDENYDKVNDEGNSGQEAPESWSPPDHIIVEPFHRERIFLYEQLRNWQNALNTEQNLNRENLRVIANLVSLLNAGANQHGLVNQVQREPNPGIDSHDARHETASAPSRYEDYTEDSRGETRITGANAL